MKIAHICLSCFFIDGRAYQENELVRQHVGDGHEVLVIASTETHDESGKIAYTTPGDYVGQEGARVIRLPYGATFAGRLSRKLRIHNNVENILNKFRPDTILFHGTCGWELNSVARYVNINPKVPLFVDSHEDWNNSARGTISRYLLHGIYYRFILERNYRYISKILCVSTESIEFVKQVYHAPSGLLELFPLGGHPIGDEEYRARRSSARTLIGVGENDILLVQSGKQTRRKRLLETLRVFGENRNDKLRLVIVGTLDRDISAEALTLMRDDPRIVHLGWQTPDQLTDLLCGADIYLQPGTQSVTMQHSLCCRCAVILDDAPSHRFYIENNGWLLNDNNRLEYVLSVIDEFDLVKMGQESFEFAQDRLDYKMLSRRIFPMREPEVHET